MYVRLFTFQSDPSNSAVIDDIAAKAQKMMEGMNGFISMTSYAGDNDTYGTITLWQSRADAEAASEKSAAELGPLLGPLFKGSPSVTYGEVLEPK